MKCEIISVGTELVLGDIVNTNAQYISRRMAELGYDVHYHISVGDNMERVVEVIRNSLQRTDIIVTSGGLGPTDDDLTKEAVCKALEIPMELDHYTLDKIKRHYDILNKKMPICNEKQALVPKHANIIENDNGTAPGLIIEKNGKIIILLPGPPKELIPMFDKKIYHYLRSKSENIIKSKTLKVIGIEEPLVQEKLKAIFDFQTNPTIAPYAKDSEVHLRITAKSIDERVANELILDLESKVKVILGENIFGNDLDTLESVVVGELIRREKTISIAESCTGGLISSRITNVPGASKVFTNSIVTYSNESKNKFLGVRQETLNNYGAVSPETSKEMAIGIKNISNTSIGLSITGIAGPEGGTKEKPIGLVYISISYDDNVKIFKEKFSGDRERIRRNASSRALDIIRREFLQV